ncbi:hypothetical protein [Tenuibacillus multivorans]|uniref:hypothetical protein n=1 Tax=Tenuibacillus multivorans TaxID=237069 RepID=UPI00116826A6|nr:hypothetical protein [Tenuibacillus multivorans]GEL77546.1 hypothetical protein TMU01_17810 [Tenuibacillus multivorans]
MIIILNIIIIIVMIFAIIGSIAAWINTNIILDELKTIKKELGIKDDKLKHFLDKKEEP